MSEGRKGENKKKGSTREVGDMSSPARRSTRSDWEGEHSAADKLTPKDGIKLKLLILSVLLGMSKSPELQWVHDFWRDIEIEMSVIAFQIKQHNNNY